MCDEGYAKRLIFHLGKSLISRDCRRGFGSYTLLKKKEEDEKGEWAILIGHGTADAIHEHKYGILASLRDAQEFRVS